MGFLRNTPRLSYVCIRGSAVRNNLWKEVPESGRAEGEAGRSAAAVTKATATATATSVVMALQNHPNYSKGLGLGTPI